MQVITNLLRDAAYLLQHHRLRLVDADLLAAQRAQCTLHMQSTLRSLRGEKISVDEAEPVMLEQISRISQQIGYYLHRASMRSGGTLLSLCADRPC